MSHTGDVVQRRSWRSQEKRRNPWPARLILTTLAAIAIGVFCYIIVRRPPQIERKTFLVNIDQYDFHEIMPAMFGKTAEQEISVQLDAKRYSGTAQTIEQIPQQAEFQECLDDEDDTLLLIIRGYLLAGDDQPRLACTDLAVDPSSERPLGLLPLARLLKPLAQQAPDAHHGARVVILDIEPLGALPRFDQYHDQAIGQLETLVRDLSGPAAENVWVLVTRGPLQNAGWNPASHLPLSTQLLLEAFRGQADVDRDDRVQLDELCRYFDYGYAQLAKNSTNETPKVMLLRGTVGTVTEVNEAANVWLASNQPVAELKDPAAADEFEEEADQESKATDDPTLTTPVVNRVSYRVPQKDQQNQNSEKKEQKDQTNRPDSAEPEVKTSDPEQHSTAPNDTALENEAGNEAGANAGPIPSPTSPSSFSSFWDVRDALEAQAFGQKLHPIAVAPHRWRTMVALVTRAEVLAFDPLEEGPRARLPSEAADDLMKLHRFTKATPPTANRKQPRFTNELVETIFDQWKAVLDQRRGERIDEQVQTADQLQQLIALGRMRAWSRLQYQQQAIICGGQSFGDDAGLNSMLEQAESRLLSQTTGNVDLAEMRRSTRDLTRSIQAIDKRVAAKIQDLLLNFERTDAGSIWPVTLHAYAWLRSSLPTGEQRRQLEKKIAESDVIAPVDLQNFRDNQTTNVEFADSSPNPILQNMVEQLKGDTSTFAKLDQSIQPWSEILANSESTFGSKLAASLRIDPGDRIKMSTPIIHSVAPRDRDRRPSITIVDSSGVPIDQIVAMESLKDSITISISPDAEQTTEFRINVRSKQSSDFDEPLLRCQWRSGPGFRMVNGEARLRVPALQSGRLHLDLLATPATDEVSDSPIEITIAPLDPNSDPLASSLQKKQSLRIRLPKPDVIRMAVKTAGLSSEMVSDLNLPDGVWLRTFASRETRFRCQLFNDADRACRIRVWLIQLPHPFAAQGVRAYWPSMLANHVDNLRRQLTDARGRVLARILENNRLKGPVDLALGVNHQRTDLTWKNPDSDATSAASETPVDPGNPATTTDTKIDVTHGMALIARMIDEEGREVISPDQVIWMIPLPWAPEQYVAIDRLEYADGWVDVSASQKANIDDDNDPDQIPGRTPITVQWMQDTQWDEYEPNSAAPRQEQTLELMSGQNSGRIRVAVPENRDETIVRLNIDGWPRALRRVIPHINGAQGRTRTRWEDVEINSVKMDYGDRVPVRRELDKPIESLEFHHPDRVFFPGRGQELSLSIGVDSSTPFTGKTGSPEITLLLDGKVRQKYWTDRLVHTVADDLADNGRIALTTTVSDLREVWKSEAASADNLIDIETQLTVGQRKKSAPLQIKLDSRRPKVAKPFRVIQSPPYYVGKPVEFEVRFSDPSRRINSVGSGVSQIHFGNDENNDGVPDDGKPTTLPNNATQKRFTLKPEKEGIFSVAAIVWDRVGLSSEPVSHSIQIEKKAPAMVVPTGPRRGTIRGTIAVKGGLRGTLSLTPRDSGIQPAGGTIEVRSSRQPSFTFTNVPEGDYTLTFDGTYNGNQRPLVWKGLKIDDTQLSLSLRDGAVAKEK